MVVEGGVLEVTVDAVTVDETGGVEAASSGLLHTMGEEELYLSCQQRY